MTSGLRQLYPGVKARPSSGWGSFVLLVLQMAVPIGGSHPAHPPRRPLAVRQPDRTPDRGSRSYWRLPQRLPSCPRGRPFGCLPRKNSYPPQSSATGVPPAVRQPFAGPTARRTASCLIPVPGNPPPPPRQSPPPTVLSTVESQVSIKRAAQTPSVCFRTYVSQEL